MAAVDEACVPEISFCSRFIKKVALMEVQVRLQTQSILARMNCNEARLTLSRAVYNQP